MKKKKNRLIKLLLVVCFALLSLPIVSIFADTPDNLTNQSDYLAIHNTTGSYAETGGPSSLSVKDADGNAILPVSNTYNDVPADATISLEYVFHLEDGDGEGEFYSYSGSNYFTVTLPNGIDFAYVIGETHDITAEDTETGSWVLGTWQFTDSNTIRVNFNADVANHSNMWGKVGVNGTFKELGPDDNTSTQVTFGTETVIINREVPPLPEIELAKSGVYNASTNDITWTVTATPPSGVDLGEYNLVDVYSSNQTYKAGSFYVGTTNIPDGSLDLTTANQVSYTFPAGTTGEQVITYKTTPTTFKAETGASTATESSSFTNTATIFWGSEAVTEPALATVKTDWIGKSGTQETTSDGTMVLKWTVNATVPGDESITGVKITDTLPAGLELLNNATYPVQVKIGATAATTVNSGTTAGTYTYTYTDVATASTLEYRFPAALSGNATLTYYTKVTNRDAMLNNNGTVNFTNRAKLSWTEMSDSSNPPGDTATATGVGSGGLLAKSAGSTTNFAPPGYITWTTTVNRNAISMTNASIKDTIPANQQLLIDADHPFTVKQGSTTVFSTTTPTATAAFTSTDSFVRDFSYAFGSISTAYTVTYSTKIVDFSSLYVNNNSVGFGNKVVLRRDGQTDLPVDGTKTYNSQMIAKSLVGSYDYATHTAQWQIVVNRNKLPLTNAVVTDTLPPGMVLLIDSEHPFTVLESGATTPLATAPTTGVNGDTSFEYKFSSAIDNQYTITFYTRLTDETLKQQWSGERDFINKASIDGDEIGTPINVTATAKIKNPVVTKTYQYQTGSDHIDWSAVINPGQIQLTNASVSDVLDPALMVDEDSVKLYRVAVNSDGSVQAAAEGTLVTSGYAVTLPTAANNNTLTVTLPDSKAAYRLEFTTFIIADDLNTVNKISLTGTSSSPSGTAEASRIEINNLWSSGGSGSMKLTVNKVNGSGDPVEGAIYRLLNFNKDPILKGGKYVEATTNASGNAVFSNLPSWVFYVVEVGTPDGYLLNTDYIGGDRLNENALYTTSDEDALGTLSFDKTATDDATLSGGTFTLTGTDYNNEDVSRTAAAVDGVVTFSDLPLGTYSVAETIAPDGYVESSETITATVTYNEDKTATVVTITSENDSIENRPLPTATVEFNKTDGVNALAGAVFTLYDQDSEEVATATSDEFGVVRFTEIPAGSYTALETSSPIGYLIYDAEITIGITYNEDKTACIVDISPEGAIVDAPIAPIDIEFTKTNGVNPLQGATFGLYNSENALLQSATSGIDGLVRFVDVGVGTYTIRETVAPKDYLLSQTELTAVISYNEENTGMDLVLTPDGPFVNEIDPATQIATVELKKTDDTGAALAGAVFGLYDGNNKLISQATSAADGKVTFADVLIGTYTIKEISAPAGYTLSTAVIPITLTAKDVDTVVKASPYTVVNKRIGATIQIKKVDASTKQALSGAVFTLFNTGGTIVATATTGSNGLATFHDVMPGAYTITETKAPDGYIASTATISVTTELAKTYTYTVENTAKKKLPQSGMFWDGKMLVLAGIFLILSGATIGLLNRKRGAKNS
ncbi:MAG TPA: SpaA isopeptide-forming pilin-related protein [Clostridiales bacterium]|nr:SpaA isopeptide-forming pilin-related protein [Clostridiales bacterium]